MGSETLDKKYNLGVSPATLRNEMVKLTALKYLKKPHTSAGRIPTPEAFRFYIKELMHEKKLSVAQEGTRREKIWDYREKLDRLLQEATKQLAEQTKTLASKSEAQKAFLKRARLNSLASIGQYSPQMEQEQ